MITTIWEVIGLDWSVSTWIWPVNLGKSLVIVWICPDITCKCEVIVEKCSVIAGKCVVTVGKCAQWGPQWGQSIISDKFAPFPATGIGHLWGCEISANLYFAQEK